MVVRAILPAKDGLEAFHVQRTPCPVQQLFVHFVECGPAFEQQVTAVFQLVKRIRVLKLRLFLLLRIERETQTCRVKPTVTSRGQPPYSVRRTQGLCDLIQSLEIGPARKTVALLVDRQAPFTSLALDPFVTVGGSPAPQTEDSHTCEL